MNNGNFCFLALVLLSRLECNAETLEICTQTAAHIHLCCVTGLDTELELCSSCRMNLPVLQLSNRLDRKTQDKISSVLMVSIPKYL